MCCVPAQAVEDANGDAGSADEPHALVREHNLYVKHFRARLDSAALRAMFEARILAQPLPEALGSSLDSAGLRAVFEACM